MKVLNYESGDRLHHRVDFSAPDLSLNLSTPAWLLGDKDSSFILGLDIVTLASGIFQPDRGRKPLGSLFDPDDLPLTTIESIDVTGVITKRYSFIRRSKSETANRKSTTQSERQPTTTYRSSSLVRYASYTDATYTPSTGIWNDTNGEFSFYNWRVGDVMAVRTPREMRGTHIVRGRTYDGNSVILDKNLTLGVVNYTTNKLDGFICQGKTVILINPMGDENISLMVKSPELYAEEGPWPSSQEGILITINEDFRSAPKTTVYRGSVLSEYPDATVDNPPFGTFCNPGDSLTLLRNQTGVGGVAEGYNSVKGYLTYQYPSSLNGLLLSNGRKVWILNRGILKLVMDFGDDVYRGTKWSFSRIANNRIMLVNSKFPPRVLHIDASEMKKGETSGDITLSGCIPPAKPTSLEYDTTSDKRENPSWLMWKEGSGGGLGTGAIRALIRGVNFEDSIATEFVPVYADTDFNIPHSQTVVNNSLDVTSADGVRIFSSTTGAGFSPYIHDRITHIEIWRTQPGGGNYYLESRILLSDDHYRFHETDSENTGCASKMASYVGARGQLQNTAGAILDPITLSPVLLSSLPILTSNEKSSYGLPPICKGVVSIQGVTLCFGGASRDYVRPTLYMKDFKYWSGRYSPCDHVLLTDPSPAENVGLYYYSVRNGDLVEILDGGLPYVAMPGNYDESLRGHDFKMHYDGSYNTRWIFNTNWTCVYTGSLYVARKASGDINVLELPNSLVIGVTYRFKIKLTWTSGSGSIELFVGTQGSGALTNGTYIEHITCTGNTSLTLKPSSTWAGDVERIELEAVDPNPTYPDVIPAGIYKPSSKQGNRGVKLTKVDGTAIDTTFSGSREVIFQILRPFVYDWPVNQSDEDVWYSRTDRFQPETFTSRTLKLSTIGDIFRRAVIVGDQVVVVMDRGVHLLRMESGILVKDTLAETGWGTPWEDSIVTVGRTVAWASPQGIRIVSVSPSPNDDGLRGVLSTFGDKIINSWLSDAYDAGETVDMGYDEKNNCLRIRRRLSDHTYRVLHMTLDDNPLATLLDDDNGSRYVLSRNVEPDHSPMELYSVEPLTGSIFRCNNPDVVHPYEGFTVQAGIEAGEATPTSIYRMGEFTPLMTGEIIRFRSVDSSIDGQVRTILTASFNTITFDPVPGLSAGDAFVIGAVRFAYRFSPQNGEDNSRVKTLLDAVVHAKPGPRKLSEGTLKASCYADFSSEPFSSVNVPVLEDGTPSIDRVLYLEGQGDSLELELSCEDARTDFLISRVTMETVEEISTETRVKE